MRCIVSLVRKLLELTVCVLHPLAVLLIWIRLIERGDLGVTARLTWALVVIVPLFPFLYVLTGNEIL